MSVTVPAGARPMRSLPGGATHPVVPVSLSEQTMARIQAVQERMAAVQYLLGSVLVKGIDYDQIQGTQKPTLLQPGAQQIDAALGIHPEFEMIGEPIMDFSMSPPFITITVRCKAVQHETGRVVGEGIGSCNSYEKKYRYRREHVVDENGRWKRDDRGGWLFNQVDNPDVADLMNTLFKMGAKRAHIAATLNASGASRLFTQDLEDLEAAGVQAVETQDAKPAAKTDAPRADQPSPKGDASQPQRRSIPRQGAPAAQPAAQSNGKPATQPFDADKARKRIYAKVKGLGLSDDDLKGLVSSLYGVKSSKDMNEVQLSWLIEKLAECERDAKQGDEAREHAIQALFRVATDAEAKRAQGKSGQRPARQTAADGPPPPSDDDAPAEAPEIVV